ncbi:aminoglycoside phosphotransferase [Cellulomonas endophytica]|uniref:aminoglycoside phosphotransferase n=1 Tax=Cellulomonas endophytica TaxID=2494735 RepID=UPI001012849B|nr:aminoglycoside phosphotransferase [Cellulomonas endophytica]
MIAVGTASPADHALGELLRPWLPARRWFPVKGVEAQVSVLGATSLDPAVAATSPAGGTASSVDELVGPGGTGVRVLLLRVLAPSVDVVLQVPLVLTASGRPPEDGDAPGAETEDPSHVGTLHGVRVRDGAGDPAFLQAWLAVADGPGAVVDVAAARVLRGEQSNTSVVLPAPGPGTEAGDTTGLAPAAPVAILKVLRAVQAGENPDVDVPRHLVRVGWEGVPRPLAWLEAAWPDPRDPQGPPQQGYLAALAAFVPSAEDGFELACDHARRGASFGDEAAALGTAVAGMHTALARAYGVDATVAGGSDPGVVADALVTRFAWAAAAVPELEGYRSAVEAVVARLRGAPAAPARQRVHGDLHLGQVLRSVDRWFITDFEGEPLAPLSERTRPDLAVRDVAGMLRSLDYAAAVGGLTGGRAQRWADESRGRLLEAYRAASAPAAPGAHAAPAPGGTVAGGADPAGDTLFLTAMELDKTLYEAVYERRNRPDWLPIPLAGLDRLLHP